MHPLCSAVPEPYVSVGVTRAALFRVPFVLHVGVTRVPPRCRTSQCRMIFISLSISQWNNLAADCAGLAGYKSRTNEVLGQSCSLPFCLLLFPVSLLSFMVDGLGLGSFD